MHPISLSSGITSAGASFDWTNSVTVGSGQSSQVTATFSPGGILTLSGNGTLSGQYGVRYPYWYRTSTADANNYGALYEIHKASGNLGINGDTSTNWFSLSTSRTWDIGTLNAGFPTGPANDTSVIEIRSAATLQVIASFTLTSHRYIV